MKLNDLFYDKAVQNGNKICSNKDLDCTNVKKNQEFKADRVFFIILLIVSVILTNVVSLLGYIIYEENILFARNILDEFSVPCENLSLSADEDYLTFDLNKGDLKTYVNSKGTYICSKKNLTEILKTVVERQYRLKFAKGDEKRFLSCGNESLRESSGYQTAYFTELLKPQNDSGNQTSSDKLYWNSSPDKSYVHDSLDYKNGVVTIPEGRDYYLYASVHFNITQKTSDDHKGFKRPQRITLRVCKTIYGYEQTLLGRSELFDVTKFGNVVGSLRLESLLHLTRNDKIYVRINDASRLILNAKGNTFGLFPL